MGDEKFFTALRAIVNRISGQPDMPAFLEQWLDREGAPVLRVDWWSADRGRGALVEDRRPRLSGQARRLSSTLLSFFR